MLKVRKTESRGLGVFTDEGVRNGAVIARFEGEVMRYSECPKSEEEYIMLIGGGYGLIPRNETRYLNHSCEPNCEVFGEHLMAIRDIEPGEELTFDYGLVDSDELCDWEKAWTFECRCGSEKCRKTIDRFVCKNGDAPANGHY